MTHHTNESRRALVFAAVSVSAAAAIVPQFCAAQTQPSTTEVSAGETEVLQARIVEVKGNVRVRPAPDQPLQPATVDMVVGESAEFLTGPRSSVTCVIPPDQTFTLDRLGRMSILEAIRDAKTVKTDLALKYGRVRYDIESAGVEHRSVIRSPSSTLAVRGTDVVLYDQPPFTPEAQSFHGRAQFGYAKQTVAVGGNGHVRATAGTSGAAETALAATVVDPRSGLARSETDQRLITNEISRGAVLSFDQTTNIAVITGGAGPLPDSQFALNPPGALDFYLRWSGNANLNLTVTLQKGDAVSILNSFNFQPTEILYPGYSLDTTASGGHIPYDHRGGPNGGQEIGYWQNVVPGLYGIAATNISGSPADFKFNVTADGKPITIFTEELTKGKQIERTLPVGQTIVGIVLVPPSKDVEAIFPNDPGPTGSSSTPQSVKNTSRGQTGGKKVQPVSVVPSAPVVSGTKAGR